MIIPTKWKITAAHKGVNIYDNDGYIIVVYSQFGTTSLKWLKTITSAKRWITSNKTYFVGIVTRSNGSQYQLFKDTIFY